MSKPPCVRCGDCCRRGGPCSIRDWCLHDVKPEAKQWTHRERQHFTGVCELLIENEDGKTSCRGLLMAQDKTVDWHEPTRRWLLDTVIGRGCEDAEAEESEAEED